MKFFAFLFSVFAFSLGGFVFAQEERDFDLADFDRIDLSAGVVLIADIGPEQSVMVKTDRGDFSDFEIDVKNGKLNVSRRWNRLAWHEKKVKYKVIVSVPSLSGVEASSGSHAKISNLDAKLFSADLSSGAHVSLEGRCDDCNVDVRSGARIHGKMFTCTNAKVDVASGGRVELAVLQNLLADASSGGGAYIFGEPTQRTIDRSSGGRVKLVSKDHRGHHPHRPRPDHKHDRREPHP